MYEIIDSEKVTKSASRLLDKIALVIGWRTTSIEKIQGKKAFIDDIKNSDLNPLEKAALISHTGKIIKEFENQSKIVGKAIPLLTEEAKPDEVDEDWFASFMDKARLISNEDLQIIWANILAGEANQPGSYSLRTLEVLKNISKDEALLFQKMSKVVLNEKGAMFILDEKLYPNNGMNFGDILRLSDCGIIASTAADLSLSINSQELDIVLFNNKIVGRAMKAKEKASDIHLTVYVLTKAGQELIYAISYEQDEEYILNVLKHMSKMHRGEIIFSANPINYINSQNINYDETIDLLTVEQVK